MLQVGLQVYPHNKDLLAALEDLAIEIGIRKLLICAEFNNLVS